MRILSVTAQKPHSTGSGVYLTKTLEAFHRLGHQNAVVAGITDSDSVSFPPDTAFYPVFYQRPSLPFPVLGMSDEMPYESSLYRHMTEEMKQQFFRAFASALQKAVEEFKPDLILAHHLYLLTAHVRQLFPKLPLWGLCHGSDLRQMYTNPLWQEEIRQGIRELDRVYYLQEPQKEAIRACFSLPEEKLFFGGPAYDAACFYDRGIRQKDGKLRLAFAGKISEKKGIFSLIAALGKLGLPPEAFSLSLYGGWGSEEQRQKAEAAIQSCPWEVKLCGKLPPSELAEAFSRADIFILPSFYEGFPLVLAEALACGAKVICTDLPGIRPQMDRLVPGHGIRFVALPSMLDADTPDPAGLAAFEERLARAILLAKEDPLPSADLSPLSWDALCRRILEA